MLVLLACCLCWAYASGALLVGNNRVQALAESLGNAAVVNETMRHITTNRGDGPGVWAWEWHRLGQFYEQQGDTLVSQGQTFQAVQQFKYALAVYEKGYLPDCFSVAELRCFKAFTMVAEKINLYAVYPFVKMYIPYEQQSFKILFFKNQTNQTHTQGNSTKPGLIIYTGGVDGSKEIGCPDMAQTMVPAGYAVACFDLAGQGDSAMYNATPASYRLHQAVLDYFEQTGEYDFTRVGMSAGSFGGFYSLQMAMREKRLKVVVDNCGLVTTVWNPIPKSVMEKIVTIPAGQYIRSFIRRMGFDPDALNTQYDEVAAGVAAFRAASMEVVGQNHTTIHIPILNADGGRDPLVPLKPDWEMVEKAEDNKETWIMGLAGHCSGKYNGIMGEDQTVWMLQKLNNNTITTNH